MFSLTPIPGTSNVQSKQEAGHLIGPTLVNIDKSETNSLQSDQSSSAANDVRYTSESPVQVIKVEGSNRLCSRGAASPDVILVSIAAVAKRASMNTSSSSINKEGGQENRNNELQSNWHSDMNLAIVAYLLSWGLDADMDEMCLKELGLKAPDLNENVSFALRSAGGCTYNVFAKILCRFEAVASFAGDECPSQLGVSVPIYVFNVRAKSPRWTSAGIFQ